MRLPLRRTTAATADPAAPDNDNGDSEALDGANDSEDRSGDPCESAAAACDIDLEAASQKAVRGTVPTLQVAGTAEPHGGVLRLLVKP